MLDFDPTAPPLYDIPADTAKRRHPDLPRGAFPLAEPLIQRPKGPVKPRPYRILQNIQSVSCCVRNNAAIDLDGVLWTWGSTSIGRMGDVISYDCPVPIDYIPKRRMEHVIAVSAGARHTMCITSDHQLWGWGENSDGELGIGDCKRREEPTRIMSGVVFVSVAVGMTFAIRENGTLWGWGANYDRLFPTSKDTVLTPLPLMEHVAYVSCSRSRCFVLRDDGTLWGLGVFTHLKAPTLLMKDIAYVASPPWEGFCMIIAKNGDLYALGGGTPGSMVGWQKAKGYAVPVKVLENVDRAWCGHYLTFVLLKDGRLLSSGENYSGQCGIGRYSARFHKPAYVMPHAKAAAAGYGHGMGLQDNGDLWIWGGDYSIPC